jgi:uncharacterized damage-inducible protein DinB
VTEHLAELPSFAQVIAEHDEMDFAKGVPMRRAKALTRQQALDAFDQNAEALVRAVNACDDERMRGKFTMRRAEQIFFTLPRSAALRAMGINHIIHHRGQLTVYLREIGVAVPGMYGPSADEQ